MGKKAISNTFTVNTIDDGQSAPYYFQEWFAWSSAPTTPSAVTEPTPNGGWQTSIPEQGSYAYLWRKCVRMVYNATTNDYDAEAAQYFRMSGLNGTSIKTKGSVIAVISRRGTFPTTGVEDGDIVIKDSDRTPYRATIRGMIVQWDAMSNADDGDSYTVIKTCYYSPTDELDAPDVKGHLFSYSEEASKWLDLGKFQGENGETWYTHVAWATNVDTSTTPITVTDFVTTKSPNDTTHIWMGVLVDQNSGQDSSNATLYTWSNTKGDGAAVATCSPDKISIQCNADGSVVLTNGYSVSFGLKVGSIDISQYITDVTRGSLPTGVSISPTPVAYAKTIVVSNTATATGMASGITFTVTGTYEGKTYSSTVNVALIGAKQGSVGERGKVGRFFYYGGTFDTNDNTPFPINDAQAPYFDYIKDGQKRFAVYNPANNPAGGSLKMSQMTPLSQGLPDLNTTGTSWEVMTNDFKYIITEAIFGNYAHFGSAIINGDWLLSTNGTINGVAYNNGINYTYNGVTKPAYTWFDASNPNTNIGHNFIPNYCVDLLTGKTYQNSAVVRGTVYADSGYFNGSLRTIFHDISNESGWVFYSSSDTKPSGMGIGWNYLVGDYDNMCMLARKTIPSGETSNNLFIRLPNTLSMIGRRIILYEMNQYPFPGGASFFDIRQLNGAAFVGVSAGGHGIVDFKPVIGISICGGLVELLAVPHPTDATICTWAVININVCFSEYYSPQ